MRTVQRTLLVVSGLAAALAVLPAADLFNSHGKTAMAETPELMAYDIIDRREAGTKKVTLTVEIQLVDGRIPFEREVRALTEHIFSLEKNFKRKFVTYYLPRMNHSEGAYATGQYFVEEINGKEQPRLEVFLRPYNLSQYPEYAKFAM